MPPCAAHTCSCSICRTISSTFSSPVSGSTRTLPSDGVYPPLLPPPPLALLLGAPPLPRLCAPPSPPALLGAHEDPEEAEGGAPPAAREGTAPAVVLPGGAPARACCAASAAPSAAACCRGEAAPAAAARCSSANGGMSTSAASTAASSSCSPLMHPSSSPPPCAESPRSRLLLPWLSPAGEHTDRSQARGGGGGGDREPSHDDAHRPHTQHTSHRTNRTRPAPCSHTTDATPPLDTRAPPFAAVRGSRIYHGNDPRPDTQTPIVEHTSSRDPLIMSRLTSSSPRAPPQHHHTVHHHAQLAVALQKVDVSAARINSASTYMIVNERSADSCVKVSLSSGRAQR